MQRGCRKGARIICIFRIIGGNTIGLVGKKTFVNNFVYALGLYFCPVFSLCICVLYSCSKFLVCQREKLYQRKLRGQPGRDHSLAFCVNAWKCFGTKNNSDNWKKKKNKLMCTWGQLDLPFEWLFGVWQDPRIFWCSWLIIYEDGPILHNSASRN